MIKRILKLIKDIKFYIFFKKINQGKTEDKNAKDIILIEYFKYQPSFISFYYFANSLKKKKF